jgi:phage-related protein
MADKPLVWLGSSLEDVRAFPDAARQEAGFQLRRVQKGLSPIDWKPMTTIGPGVIEVRIHTTEEYRVFYVAKFAEAVYVLHAFDKKTQKTPQRDIDLAQRRYSELIRTRSKSKEK